ncbi:winged helix-turn-helix transcriptional regulator [Acinetobacter terrestris]|uniref:winged helix-turn-helix transcriptional regulator n=1 Tax=Acinetobacter terrestris TaxID=2529843 RepID=UPI00103DA6C8|nr:helix-turn-helix domain-containing protein [Acinetobacter terrestris]TCB51598.1 transcriptional regulator [Acinetobacter terrestris]
MDTSCGLDISLKIMGGKWKPLILYHLQKGPLRFSEIKRSVGGISEKVLIQQLRDLVAINVLNRHDYKCVPPRVDYSLTAFGQTLVQALIPLCEWGNQNREQVTIFLQTSSELN